MYVHGRRYHRTRSERGHSEARRTIRTSVPSIMPVVEEDLVGDPVPYTSVFIAFSIVGQLEQRQHVVSAPSQKRRR